MTLAQQGVPGELDVSERAGADAVLQSAVRKAALRFVPLLTIAYLFNYLDRTSLGFAALTMNQQLGLTAVPVRFCRGRLLSRLFAVRSTEQSDALSFRRAALARPHHDQLGHRVGGDRFRGRAEQLLRASPAARDHGSRVLSGRDVLSRRLVSRPIPHADAGLVPGRDSLVLAGRQARFAACFCRWRASGVSPDGNGCFFW